MLNMCENEINPADFELLLTRHSLKIAQLCDRLETLEKTEVLTIIYRDVMNEVLRSIKGRS